MAKEIITCTICHNRFEMDSGALESIKASERDRIKEIISKYRYKDSRGLEGPMPNILEDIVEDIG